MTPGAPSASKPDSRIERFSKGDRFAVSPEGIERELASLWRDAGESTEGHQPVTRACLWNLIVHLEDRPGQEGSGHTDRLAETLKELPRYLASRTLILRTGPGRDGAPELESWISANCAVSPEGGKVVCSEEITIASRGAGEEHLPALVRALIVPDVPTAALFAGVPPRDRPTLTSLVRAADRVVVRADASSDPAVSALKRITALGAIAPLGAIDIGWVMQAPLRSLVAELFEPPVPPEAASAIREVVATCRPDSPASGRLALSWIAAVLEARDPREIGTLAWRLTRPGGSPLVVRLVEDSESPLAVSGMKLISEGKICSVRMLNPGVAQLSPQEGPPRQVQLEKLERASALSAALRTRSHDRAFDRALAIATRL